MTSISPHPLREHHRPARWRLLLWGVTVLGTLGSRQAIAQEPAGDHTSHTNLLEQETSPYLLQHAHNPVDWRPWGDDAFRAAAESDRPIFLSIGYAACHWCHVMERESFTDAEIAAYLNEHFVCVKVDREERPDVDEIYMTALLTLGSRGGWPLSAFLTADGKPFFAGTYWPPRDREIKAEGENEAVVARGFLTILKAVVAAWRDHRAELVAAGDQVAAAVAQNLARRSFTDVEPLGREWLDELVEVLAVTFDAEHGGFGYSAVDSRQPKFPEPSNLLFLLDHIARRGEDAAGGTNAGASTNLRATPLTMLTVTLDHLSAGGIYDHLGGGFHRYSTDRFWRVPHFEKMLYDNALSLSTYARAFAATRDERYRRVASEIVEFMLRDLRHTGGAFYASIDADSQGQEGAYYVWDRAEIESLLTPDEFAAFSRAYLSPEPNFEGKWVLEDISPRGEATDAAFVLAARGKLLAARQKRSPPATDTKLLCAWNGLAIRGLADAARLAEIDGALDAARRCADFTLANLADGDRLLRSHAGGRARFDGYLDDYAYLIDGLIALEQATGEARWLAAADTLQQAQLERFWDDTAGGFFYTADDHESLIARSKDAADSATPSANAVSARNLIYLAERLDRRDYLDRADQTIRAFTHLMDQTPSAMPTMGMALGQLLDAREAAQ